MKKTLGAWIPLLPLFVLMTGCEDLCRDGIVLRNDQAILETIVTSTVTEPTKLASTCYEFKETWRSKLGKGADLALTIARKRFREEHPEYELALSVRRELRWIKTGLHRACSATAKDDIVTALAELVDTKERLTLAKNDTDEIIVKAGCFDPNRKGD